MNSLPSIVPLKSCSAREAAFRAAFLSWNGDAFVGDVIDRWRKEAAPSDADLRLAYEIASGTTRMRRTLDFIMRTIVKKVALKRPGRLLLLMALYQHCFMSRIPLYAIADETVRLAKKLCYKNDVAFINAFVRKLEGVVVDLPSGSDSESLGIAYSYPDYIVERFVSEYGVERARDIMAAGNAAPALMVRRRHGAPLLEGMTALDEEMASIDDGGMIARIAASESYYIQNSTSATLVKEMCRSIAAPKKVLDLCSAPGGKALAVHDIFPEAHLVLNDVSDDKIAKVRENVEKYHIDAVTTISRGENFSTDERFDLIILDVPCSNSGTLARRADARWRLSSEAVMALTDIQRTLIGHAATLLAPGGTIAYMTCSILKEENEELVAAACEIFDLRSSYTKKILPEQGGADGGFVTLLSKR